MSAQHLEVLDTTLQKTHQWLDAIAETADRALERGRELDSGKIETAFAGWVRQYRPLPAPPDILKPVRDAVEFGNAGGAGRFADQP
jgi:hypothetical protein